ncbi:DUF3443 domain-containing protein [Trinickia fusca]|uniref:DUF3443 domain-containing protein n=1 Tax=Trinickia fusca TaxID=2419777 RepID=UPI003CCC8E89
MRIHSVLVRVLSALGLATAVALVAGCGGGGGGGSSSTSSSSTTSSSGPSSSGPSSGSTNTAPLVANQVPVTVGYGYAGGSNIPTVSVTLCAPGTSNCQTIDNIQVDTMSFGLRLTSTAASAVLGSLPQVTSGGAAVAECTQFADGYTWGSVRLADVKIGGETASNLPINILGDVPQSAVSSGGCASGTLETSGSALGANGILGIGVSQYDCGSGCATQANNGMYYGCPGGTNCTGTTLPLTSQVATPMRSFAADNNGVSLTMPSVGPSGASLVSGVLTFGVATQSNNALPTSGVTVYTSDRYGDTQSATYNGALGYVAFFDSGSNAYFVPDPAIPRCTGQGSWAYCPSSTVSRTIGVTGYNGASGSFPISIANAQQLFASGAFASNDLGGTLGGVGSKLDMGLPFFYGRTVYYGYDLTGTGGPQPYVAF